MQAKSRVNRTLPARSADAVHDDGLPVLQEFEYRRHGTPTHPSWLNEVWVNRDVVLDSHPPVA